MVALRLNIVGNLEGGPREIAESGPGFLCYCGFLMFPMTALEFCIRLTFNYLEAD